MSKDAQEIKKIVDSIVSGLKRDGIDVSSVKAVKINPADFKIEETLNKINAAFPGLNLTKEGFNEIREKVEAKIGTENDGPCFCPNCLTFDAFEQVLGNNGKYDYASVTLNGKNFNIKYYEGENGTHMMISDEEKKQQQPKTKEQLLMELTAAVRRKDYDTAEKLSLELTAREENEIN